MWPFKRTGLHWSLNASRRELRRLAYKSILEMPKDLIPSIRKEDFANTSKDPFAFGMPIVLQRYSLFQNLIGEFIRKNLRSPIPAQIFNDKLKEAIDKFNSQVGLPPVTYCKLFDGSKQYPNHLVRGRYSFTDGGMTFHYQFNLSTFAEVVAHELTHLEQDYLFICYLADYLQIGSTFGLDDISRLSNLAEQNGNTADKNKLQVFLSTRDGRFLDNEQKKRATAITNDFRSNLQFKAIKKDLDLTDTLAPKKAWWQKIFQFYDYEKFWHNLVAKQNEIPQGLQALFREASAFVEKSTDPKKYAKAGKIFYRLLRYYSQSSEIALRSLHFIWQKFSFFEREAYALGQRFRS